MNRLDRLNMQFNSSGTRAGGKPRGKPVTDVWESMHLDQYLSKRVVDMRKATGKMMDECRERLYPHIEATSFPEWIVDKIRPLGINGCQI